MMLLLSFGCTQTRTQASPTASASTSSVATSTTGQPAASDTTTEVPGVDPPAPLPIQAADGSPRWCSELANSSPLRDLRRAFGLMADPATAAAGQKQLSDSASSLKQIFDSETGTLKQAAADTSAALASLSSAGMGSATNIKQVSEALQRLGKEVQSKCGYPIG